MEYILYGETAYVGSSRLLGVGACSACNSVEEGRPWSAGGLVADSRLVIDGDSVRW